MTKFDQNYFINNFIKESSNTICKLSNQIDLINKISESISESIINGNKVLACGNGGSAADAQHFVAEMLVRFRSDNNRISLPAIALTQDVSTLTACANDYSFEETYSRLLSSLGKSGDILLAISTSGNSENILKAIETAKNKDIKVILLTGFKSTKMSYFADYVLNVEDENTARIQQAHITIIHLIMYQIEYYLSINNFL